MKKKNVIIISIIIIISIGLFIGYGKEKPIEVISGGVCDDGSPKEMHAWFACFPGFEPLTEGYVIVCEDTFYCDQIFAKTTVHDIGTIGAGKEVKIKIK